MSERVYNVLFLCTGNSARSIMAEAILNRIGRGRFKAYSAGSAPKGAVHPQALALLRRLDFPVEGLRSKSWDEFAAPGVPGAVPGKVCNVGTLSLPTPSGTATTQRHGAFSRFDETRKGSMLDFVFTVCDNAANEVCPVWPGQPMTAHWGVPDPAAVQGDEKTIAQAFRDAFLTLQRRIELFAALPVDKLDRMSLLRRLDEIGKAAGAHESA